MNDGLHPKVTNFDNQIVTFKLVASNQNVIEIVGRLLSRDAAHIWIEYPQALMPFKDKQNNDQVGLLDFMVSGEGKTVEFRRDLVLSMTIAKKSFADEYERIIKEMTKKKSTIIT